MKDLAIFVASNFEDIELIGSLDIFSRNNVSYELFSVENKNVVKGKYNAFVETKEIIFFNEKEFKGIFLPGGPGVDILINSKKLIKIIKKFENKFISAICAAPEILVKANVLKTKLFTSYPGYAIDKNNTGKPVEVSDKLITGRDFYVTFDFANKVSEVIKNV